MNESGSTGSSTANSYFAEEEETAAKTWFNPFIVQDYMLQNSVVAKLNNQRKHQYLPDFMMNMLKFHNKCIEWC